MVLKLLTRNYIEDLVKEGLVIDIFKMEQAYGLLKSIGLKSKELNWGNLQVYNGLFRTIQDALETEALLAAARIYDLPSKKYSTRCLRGVLKYLSDNINELPTIREPHQLVQHLKYMNAPIELINTISNSSDNFAKNFSAYIEYLLSTPERLDALLKLKIFRDKALAHNERRNLKILGPTWDSLKDLMEITKNVVGVLGWAYFSTAYVINGKYILSEDALRTTRALNKLFKVISLNQ